MASFDSSGVTGRRSPRSAEPSPTSRCFIRSTAALEGEPMMRSPCDPLMFAPYSPAERGGGSAAAPDQPSPIAALNDAFRRDFRRERLLLTQGVASRGDAELQHLLREVQRFDQFTPDNDPYGEHDFGKVTVEEVSYFWKIDCFHLDVRCGSPDPADADVTTRILTVMRSDEY